MAVAGTRDLGYLVLEHARRIVGGYLIWAPAIEGAFVVTTRTTAFELNVGQDISISYLSHADSAAPLHLQKSVVFRVLISEATVALTSLQKAS
jgi:uncharacterized linocin/CFP29 family protein